MCGLEFRIALQTEQTMHAAWRKRAEEAEVALAKLLDAFKAADDERLKETDEAHTEASRWRGEGDMYGWNFHEGRAAGTTSASIVFWRVRRLLEKLIAGGSA